VVAAAVPSSDLAVEVSKHRAVKGVAVDIPSLVLAVDHSVGLGCSNISYRDFSQDQKILAANQNSDLNEYHYYP
jgi:hypothetical protein